MLVARPVSGSTLITAAAKRGSPFAVWNRDGMPELGRAIELNVVAERYGAHRFCKLLATVNAGEDLRDYCEAEQRLA